MGLDEVSRFGRLQAKAGTKLRVKLRTEWTVKTPAASRAASRVLPVALVSLLAMVAARLGTLLLGLIGLLVPLSFITYLLLACSPIDPVQAYIGADIMRVGPEQRLTIEAYWGLDKPLLERYALWLSAAVRGDLGTSLIYRAPVLDIIGEKAVNSLLLMGSSWLLAGVLGFAAGAVAALGDGRWVGKAITGFAYMLVSAPPFWLGLLLLMVFSVQLGWLPVGLASPAGVEAAQVSGADRLRHIILPMATLSIVGIAPITLHTRQKLLEVLAAGYMRFAIARGVYGWRLLWRHGLRNVALPALTLQFATFSELFGGAILAEQLFSYPGLGQAAVESGLKGDVPLLLAIVLCSALFVVAGNKLADWIYPAIDPRLRLREGGWRDGGEKRGRGNGEGGPKS